MWTRVLAIIADLTEISKQLLLFVCEEPAGDRIPEPKKSSSVGREGQKECACASMPSESCEKMSVTRLHAHTHWPRCGLALAASR